MKQGKDTNHCCKHLRVAGILVVTALAVAALLAMFLLDRPTGDPASSNQEMGDAPGSSVEVDVQNPTGDPAGSNQEMGDGSEVSVQIDLEEQSAINLGYGLEIVDSGKYTGIYMEDGSDEVVSGIMMIAVHNTSEQDVQYAQIQAVCGEKEYEFVLTNLAAGAKVVLLDQQRREASGAALTSAVAENVALFSEPMDLMEDTIEIGGLDGMLNVKNLSAANITGDIFVYYKYASEDMFYGGITFRVRIEGGLAAGELRQIPAGHYSPKGCALVQVTVNG